LGEHFNCRNKDRIILWKLKDEAAGNKELSAAIELAEIVTSDLNTTIAQILNHPFLKLEIIKKRNHSYIPNIENVPPNSTFTSSKIEQVKSPLIGLKTIQ